MTHQLQSSPGSADRMIGWPSAWACLLAWRFGDESQQPILPQLMHIRRCTQRSADGETVLAAGDRFRQLHDTDLVRVGADRAHVATSESSVARSVSTS